MANTKIKGITIEIGGDTTKLGKALDQSEKKSRSLQVELKEINKALKFDPSNVELLSQKQTVLSQNIDETSSKLDTLREAERQVIAQFERGEVAEDQVRALQREIIKTEGVLDSMKSELSSTNTSLDDLAKGVKKVDKSTQEYQDSVKEANETLKDFGDKVGEVSEKAKTGLTVIGTSAIAGAGYALKISTEFDKAYNVLQTRTGATVEEMESLNASMERVYSNNFGESIEDVAQSMAIVKTNTKLSGEELEKASERALLLRDVFEFDVNESTRSAKMLMDQYGLSAEEAFTLIAQGAQNGLDKNGDLLDTVNEYAVHFKGLGLDAKDMFNMLTNGAESGTFSVDKLGDAVKEFGIRVKDGSESTKAGFEAIGLNADEMSKKFGEGGKSAKSALKETAEALFAIEDPLKQNEAGVALFGTMWEDLGVEGIKALMNLKGEAKKSADTLDQINEAKYDDIGSALQGLGRTLETDVIKPLGDDLKPVVEEAIEYVKENGPGIKDVVSNIATSVGDLIGWIVDHKDAVVSTIVAIGAGLLVWNVGSMIMTVVGAIKAYQLANQGATIAQALFNAVLNANPIVLIASLVAMLVAGIVTFIATNDDARAKFEEVWGKIKEFIGPILDAIGGFFVKLWEDIKAIWEVIEPTVMAWWETVKALFALYIDLLILYFKNAWEGIKLVWSVAVDYFKMLWENIKLVFAVVVTYFKGLFATAFIAIKAVWDGVTGYFKAIWETIKGIFSVVKKVLSGDFKGAWESIKGIVKTWASYFGGVWQSIKNVFASVKHWFKTTFSSAWTAIKGVFSNWGSFFSGLWDKIKNTFSKIGSNISDAIGGSIKSGLNKVISSVEKTVNNAIGLINGAIGIINDIPGVKVGKLSKLSLPRLAKGGIVNNPTIAEIGEDGREAIIPLENNTEWINGIARKLNDYQDPNTLNNNNALLDKLDDIYSKMDKINRSIVLDSGVLVGETINQIDAKLATNYQLKARGV